MDNSDSNWSGSDSSSDESDIEDEASGLESDSDSDANYLYSFNPNLSSAELQKLMGNVTDGSEEEESEDDTAKEEPIRWNLNGNFVPMDCEEANAKTAFFIPGITIASTPLEIFTYFVPKIELEKICPESSQYVDQRLEKARQKGAALPFKHFTSFGTTELYRYLALRFATGLIKKNSIKDYWSTKPMYNTPFFPATMSRNRFEEIGRSLHFCNNTNCDFKLNRMLKLGSLPQFMMSKFAECIDPGRNLCIDESLAKYKGQLSFRQYIPNKRARFGVKLYVLADCDTKFIINVLPYQGETTELIEENDKSELGYGGAVVKCLIKPYLNSNRIVYIDNYFNSPTLAKQLTELSTGVVGTVRMNRKQMPKFTSKLKKGQVETFTNGVLLVERWVDRRKVLMLNNCIRHEMKPNSKQKIKPSSVLSYNSCMGAVDELDKSLQPYFAERKCLRWYQKIWLRYLYIAALNSLRVYNSFRCGKQKLPFKVFLENFIQELIESNPIAKPAKVRSTFPTCEARLTGHTHFPRKVFKTNANTHKTKPDYLRCVMCSASGNRHETSYECSECKICLCVGIRDRPCFEKYHSDRKIPTKKRRMGVQTLI